MIEWEETYSHQVTHVLLKTTTEILLQLSNCGLGLSSVVTLKSQFFSQRNFLLLGHGDHGKTSVCRAVGRSDLLVLLTDGNTLVDGLQKGLLLRLEFGLVNWGSGDGLADGVDLHDFHHLNGDVVLNSIGELVLLLSAAVVDVAIVVSTIALTSLGSILTILLTILLTIWLILVTIGLAILVSVGLTIVVVGLTIVVAGLPVVVVIIAVVALAINVVASGLGVDIDVAAEKS